MVPYGFNLSSIPCMSGAILAVYAPGGFSSIDKYDIGELVVVHLPSISLITPKPGTGCSDVHQMNANSDMYFICSAFSQVLARSRARS